MESYKTITKHSEGYFRDRGSKFLAYAYPISAVSELEDRIAALQKIHPKARHICYAYRIGPEGKAYRANDDGEPSGTAGRPILGQIDSMGLINTIVLVIRYFGGTKLGTSGLINAYKVAAREALDNNEIVEKKLMAYYRLDFDYSVMARVMEVVKKSSFDITYQEFELHPFLNIEVKKEGHETSAFNLQAAIAGVIPEVFDLKKDAIGFEMSLERVD